MFKIGDFSNLSRISVKTLRYYDEIGLLKPVEIDRFTGYRYYSAEQLPRLNRIVALKELGFSLEEIGSLLSDSLSLADIRGIMRDRKEGLARQLNDTEIMLAKLEEWLKKMEKEGNMPKYDVIIKEVAAQKVASLRDTVPTYQDVTPLFTELCEYLINKKAQWIGPPLALYHDCEFKERDVDVELAVPITGTLAETARIKIRELPAIPKAASLIHHGPYEQLHEAYKALMNWVAAKNYRIVGPDREVYLTSPEECKSPDDYITELQVPIENVS